MLIPGSVGAWCRGSSGTWPRDLASMTMFSRTLAPSISPARAPESRSTTWSFLAFSALMARSAKISPWRPT